MPCSGDFKCHPLNTIIGHEGGGLLLDGSIGTI